MFKDSTITAQQKKREITIWLFCFLGAIIFNVVGIIMYNTNFIELFTQIHVVLLLSLVFYALTWLFRSIYWLVKRIIKKPRKA